MGMLQSGLQQHIRDKHLLKESLIPKSNQTSPSPLQTESDPLKLGDVISIVKSSIVPQQARNKKLNSRSSDSPSAKSSQMIQSRSKMMIHLAILLVAVEHIFGERFGGNKTWTSGANETLEGKGNFGNLGCRWIFDMGSDSCCFSANKSLCEDVPEACRSYDGYLVEEEGDTCTLTIPNIRKEDSGPYTMQVRADHDYNIKFNVVVETQSSLIWIVVLVSVVVFLALLALAGMRWSKHLTGYWAPRCVSSQGGNPENLESGEEEVGLMGLDVSREEPDGADAGEVAICGSKPEEDEKEAGEVGEEKASVVDEGGANALGEVDEGHGEEVEEGKFRRLDEQENEEVRQSVEQENVAENEEGWGISTTISRWFGWGGATKHDSIEQEDQPVC